MDYPIFWCAWHFRGSAILHRANQRQATNAKQLFRLALWPNPGTPALPAALLRPLPEKFVRYFFLQLIRIDT